MLIYSAQQIWEELERKYGESKEEESTSTNILTPKDQEEINNGPITFINDKASLTDSSPSGKPPVLPSTSHLDSQALPHHHSFLQPPPSRSSSPPPTATTATPEEFSPPSQQPLFHCRCRPFSSPSPSPPRRSPLCPSPFPSLS
ncbi:proline-rich receptor-like protein kinase PERK14 [Malania oleifera]|uniref:proline-rich receptor-like protein kinase PERK14 n=1 Tax=Malania oleifera TaxID=397392 RepID=UPI0025ADCC1F|nr:proline-rich receptor-like protein kinase PERK14 [Malania oleifera]